jgi:hypothetical protein
VIADVLFWSLNEHLGRAGHAHAETYTSEVNRTYLRFRLEIRMGRFDNLKP